MSSEIVVSSNDLQEPDFLAGQISDYWILWDGGRAGYKKSMNELRNYIFATDTTTTSNSTLPWHNKTTLPKLTQIRDNLHANYIAALFSTRDWLLWEGSTEDSVSQEQSLAIQAYMKTKLDQGTFYKEIDMMLLDYIDGNVFALSTYKNDTIQKTEHSADNITVYSGPVVTRISPSDIVFNPAAVSFEASPKIIRSIVTLGELLRETEQRVDLSYDKKALKKIMQDRAVIGTVSGGSQTSPMDKNKTDAYRVDGFGSLYTYFSSGYVELLTFYGDIFDMNTQTLMRDRIICVADRRYILYNQENPSWHGVAPIRHVGWRKRPDNLWCMGPLENLVGMQYRIDHLENLKADAFDTIAYPMIKVKGDVEDFKFGPLERIYVHDEGDVEFMHPDTTVLQADNQIARLEQLMEEFAGAPKEAMGIRTPGEKTAYEMQQLMTAAGRIFQTKITEFEIFLEKVLNDMLEQARRNMNVEDVARVVDGEVGVVEFIKINPQTIKQKGKIRPVGARHFAETAKKVQELTAFAQSAIGQDPAVNVHFSGFALAKAFERMLGMEAQKIVQKNVRILEQFETQQIMQQAQMQLQVEGQMPVEEDEVTLANQQEVPVPENIAPTGEGQ